MPVQSTYVLAKGLESEILRLLSGVQAAGLMEGQVQRDIERLRHELADIRLDIRDYELAETRAEQAKLGNDARRRLKLAEQAILAASQYNIFSAIEIAQLSATIAQLIERLD